MARKKKTLPEKEIIEPISGQDIRQQRESRGISLDEIKETTKIGKFTLKLIEDDMYSSLPAPIYLRSFIRQIAGIIGMNPGKTADGYMKRMQELLKKRK